MIFLQLAILSHILADFIFQTNKLVREKNSSESKVSKKAHRIHSFIVFSTSFLLLFLPCSPDIAFIYSLIIALTHHFIDLIKYKYFSKDDQWKFTGFILDQIVHLITIVVLWRIFEINFKSYMLWLSNVIYANFSHLLVPITENMVINIFNTLIVYSFICWGGAVIIDLILNLLGINSKSISKDKKPTESSLIEAETSLSFFPFRLPVKSTTNVTIKKDHDDLKEPDVEKDDRSYLLSKYIGVFERLIIITLVMKSSYQSIAFVFAAKSLARSGNMGKKDKDFADYYLIGTLLSTSIAILGGILLTYMLGV